MQLRSLVSWMITIVCVFVGGFILILPFPRTWSKAHSQHPSNRPDPAYQSAIHLAQRDGVDELGTHFAIAPPVMLQVPVHKESRVVTTDRHIAVVDVSEPRVYLFSSDGTLERRLGQPGLGPGEYITPVSATFMKDSLAVVDFTKKRVSVFAFTGQLKGSFSYSPQGFSAQAIRYDPRTDQLFLFGNRWPELSGESSILFVHRYTADGTFEGSGFSLPSQGEALQLDKDDSPLVEAEDSADALRFMLPWQNKVYSLSPKGQTSVIFDGYDDDAFRAPTSAMPLEDRNLADIQHWMLSWTPVVGFATDGDNLLIETQCFCPTRYRLALWSLTAHKLLDSIHTNRLLVGRDQKHSFMFLQESDNEDKSAYALIKAHTRQ